MIARIFPSAASHPTTATTGRPLAMSWRRRAVTIAVMALLLGQGFVAVAPAPAHADDKDDKVKRKQVIDKKIEDLRIQLDDVDGELSDTYLALARTELEIPDAQKALDDARTELGNARAADAETGRRLTDAQNEEKTLTGKADEDQAEVDRSDEELTRLSLDAYKGGGVPNPASIYIGGADPQDAVDRSMNYRLTLQTQGTRLGDLRTEQSVTADAGSRLVAVRAEITTLKARAEQTLARTEKAEKEASDAKVALDDLYTQQTQQKADLEAKKAQYTDQQGDLQDESSTLDSEIDALTKKEQEAAKKGAPIVTVPANADTGGSSNPSGFIKPVNAAMNSNFGWRVHPVFHTRKLHAGVDFPVACGTPVKAAQDGTVIATEHKSLAGNKLTISHGAQGQKIISTSYHHLQGFAASTGQKVSRGQVIGYVGTTGASTGCHLHFAVYENGTPVDPAGYL